MEQEEPIFFDRSEWRRLTPDQLSRVGSVELQLMIIFIIEKLLSLLNIKSLLTNEVTSLTAIFLSYSVYDRDQQKSSHLLVELSLSLKKISGCFLSSDQSEPTAALASFL